MQHATNSNPKNHKSSQGHHLIKGRKERRRKKRRRKEEPWSKFCHSPKKEKHSSNYIHHTTNPNTRVDLLASQEHVQVTLRHPQTYVSNSCHACRWHTKQTTSTQTLLSQDATRTSANHHPKTYIHFPHQRQYLLACILVTFPTFHLLMSPLKTEAAENTVTRKEGRVHLQST